MNDDKGVGTARSSDVDVTWVCSNSHRANKSPGVPDDVRVGSG